MPYGIFEYRLTEEAALTLKEYFPQLSFSDIKPKRNHQSPESRLPAIDSLIIMGSIGSIGQNEKSDFDYWVCMNTRNITKTHKTLLEEKLVEIERWSAEQHIEVHFFIADPEKIEVDDFGGSDKESVGSSLGKVLKEEFYRTMILVHGKKPLWWIMPPGVSDQEYQELKKTMEQTLEPEPGNFIDFGNISKITYDEYFGAALWQLNKAMESPYKSALKMALLESYLDPDITDELLCEKLKRSVFAASDTTPAIDSYQIMINRVLDYNASLDRKNTVELLRRCFYIKSRETEGLKGPNLKNNFKQSLLDEYLKKWGWSESFIKTHNNYGQWGFSEVLALGKELHDYMIETYKRLSDYAKTKPNLKRKLTDSDLTVLGRKLFSFYSVRKNKILFLKQPFGAGTPLENVTFHVTFEKSGNPVWSVYRGQLQKNKLVFSKNRLLKRGFDLPQILMWMLINKICDTRTNYYLIPNSVPVSLEEIQRAVKELSAFFPRINIASIPNKDLFKQPKVQKLFLVINFLSQPWTRKIEQIQLLYATSWGEFYCENYDEKNGIIAILKYVKELPKLVTFYEGNTYKIFIPRGEDKTRIQKKINSLILKNL